MTPAGTAACAGAGSGGAASAPESGKSQGEPHRHQDEGVTRENSRAGTPPPNLDPLRGSSPQGEGENLELAAWCGAKSRAGPPCQAPAMANGRCRIHGGTSTGPRTAAGLARLAAARTTSGAYSAANWVNDRHVRMQARRGRVLIAATKLSAYLPPEMAARLAAVPAELRAPVHPSNVPYLEIATKTQGGGGPDVPGRGAAGAFSAPRVRAAELAAARAERAALAPWRAALAAARLAKREVLAARRAARIGKHDKDPHDKGPGARLPGAGLGARAAGIAAATGAGGAGTAARMGKHDKDPGGAPAGRWSRGSLGRDCGGDGGGRRWDGGSNGKTRQRPWGAPAGRWSRGCARQGSWRLRSTGAGRPLKFPTQTP